MLDRRHLKGLGVVSLEVGKGVSPRVYSVQLRETFLAKKI
jgi:hypothetical protein